MNWLSAWRSLDPKIRAVRFPITIIIAYLIIDFGGQQIHLNMSSWPLAIFFISLLVGLIIEIVIARFVTHNPG